MEQLIDYIRRYLVEHQNEYEACVKEKGAHHDDES